VDRELNYVFLEAGEMLVAEMRWDDSWGAAARDLDLLLFDVNDLFALAFSAGVQDGGFGQYPWEALVYEARHTGMYALAA
jgi:hypothetical protein